MTVASTTLLFFDASCLFVASDPPQGGSAYLLSVCARGYLQAAVSLGVLIEAERNIVEKLPGEAFSRFRATLHVTPFVLVPIPTEEAVRTYEQA